MLSGMALLSFDYQNKFQKQGSQVPQGGQMYSINVLVQYIMHSAMYSIILRMKMYGILYYLINV